MTAGRDGSGSTAMKSHIRCVGGSRLAALILMLISVAASHAAPKRDVASGEIDKPSPGDRAAVADCLTRVAEAQKRHTLALNKAQEEGSDQPHSEKIDVTDWLARAGERASIDEASCIGVVSEACQKTAE